MILYGPDSDNSYPESVENAIVMVEENLFNECLGNSLYFEMMEDKIQYDIKPAASGKTEYENFNEGTVYAVGKYVLYQGIIYKVIKETTGIEVPGNASYFSEAEKFENEFFNFAWYRYIVKILAWKLASETSMHNLVRSTANGVVKNYTEGSSVPATMTDLLRKKKVDYEQIQNWISALEVYVKANPSAFANSILVSCDSGNCGRKRKHFGFNTNKEW